MCNFQSKPSCSQFNYNFLVLERSLQESGCSEAFDKTGDVVNSVLTIQYKVWGGGLFSTKAFFIGDKFNFGANIWGNCSTWGD